MAEAVWQDYTPLTPGQQMHVDNLLSIETDNLAREVLITLKREGLPPNDQWREFLEQYALTGWYAASDAIAWATLAKIANSEWDKTFAYADEDYVETTAQDLGDNAIEGLIVIDAETGDTLFDRTGVVRADGSQYVGMQDTEADALLAEALSGRDLIFVHNHPNGNDASEEDLDSAFRAGAELLIVITPQGQEYVYIRGKYGMVKVRDEKASYVVGPENPEETEELRAKSEEQEAAFLVDSPELIFLQEESEFRKDLIEFGGMFVESTNLASLSDSDLLRAIVNHEMFTAFSTVAYFLGGKADYATNAVRALYIRESADATGFDPTLLAMVQLWEDYAMHHNPMKSLVEHGSYTYVYAANPIPPGNILRGILGEQEKSFGLVQIQIPVAIDMLNRYPGWFEDLDLPVDDMQSVPDGYKLQNGWSNYDVGYQLHTNEEFNIRVAGAYLRDFETRLEPYLRKLGVEVSEEPVNDPYISGHELQLLAAVGYNQGWGGALAKLQGLVGDRNQDNIAPGDDPVVLGIRRTLQIAYIDNVRSKENEALDKYGLFYGGNRDEG